MATTLIPLTISTILSYPYTQTTTAIVDYTTFFEPLDASSLITKCSIYQPDTYDDVPCTAGNVVGAPRALSYYIYSTTYNEFRARPNLLTGLDIWLCLECTNPSGTVFSDTFRLQITGDCSSRFDPAGTIPSLKFYLGAGVSNAYQYTYDNVKMNFISYISTTYKCSLDRCLFADGQIGVTQGSATKLSGTITIDTSTAFDRLYTVNCYINAPNPSNFLIETRYVQIQVLDTSSCQDFVIASGYSSSSNYVIGSSSSVTGTTLSSNDFMVMVSTSECPLVGSRYLMANGTEIGNMTQTQSTSSVRVTMGPLTPYYTGPVSIYLKVPSIIGDPASAPVDVFIRSKNFTFCGYDMPITYPAGLTYLHHVLPTGGIPSISLGSFRMPLNCYISSVYILEDPANYTSYHPLVSNNNGSYYSSSVSVTANYNTSDFQISTFYVLFKLNNLVNIFVKEGASIAAFVVNQTCLADSATITYPDSKPMTQYVEDNAPYTHFVQDWASTNLPSLCYFLTMKSSELGTSLLAPSSGFVNNPANLTNSTYSSIMMSVAPQDPTAHMSYSFYIQHTDVGGQISYSSMYQLVVGCPNVGFTTSGEGGTETKSIAIHSSRFGAASTSTLQQITEAPWCNIVSSSVTDILIDGVSAPSAATLSSNCPQPCSSIDLATTDALHQITFNLKAHYRGGLKVTTWKSFSITVECLTGSTSFTPSISNYTIDSAHLDPSPVTFEFTPFTCSEPLCCSTMTYKLTDSASSTTDHSFFPALQFDALTNKYHTTVDTSALTSQTAYIYVNNNKGDQMYTTPLTFNVICTPISTTVTQGAYSSGLSAIQVVRKDNNGGQTEFVLPAFVTSNPSCPITTYKVSNVSASLVAPTSLFVNDPIQSGTQWVVVPQNLSFEGKYEFYVQVQAQGGSLFYSQLMTLAVECSPLMSVTDSPSFVYNTSISANNPTNYAYPIHTPVLGYSYCLVIQTAIKELTMNGSASNDSLSLASNCQQPCLSIHINTVEPNTTMTFKIDFKISPTFSYTSPLVTLSVTDCDATSTQIISPVYVNTSFSAVQEDTVNNTFTFDSLYCTFPQCCKNFTQKVVQFEAYPVTEQRLLPLTILGPYLYVKVPTLVPKLFKFFLFAENSYGTYNFSQEFSIQVKKLEIEDLGYADILLDNTEEIEEAGEEEEEEVVEEAPVQEATTAQSNTQESEFVFDFNKTLEAQNQKKVEVIIKQEFACKIDEFNEIGVMTIKFSTAMKDQNAGTRVSKIDFRVLNVTYLPSTETLQNIEAVGGNISMLDYQWKTESFIDDELKLMFTFQNPLMVSSGLYQRDYMSVQIIDPGYFQDLKMQMDFSTSSFDMKTVVKRQMVDDPLANALVNSKVYVESSMNTIAIGQFVSNAMISVSLSSLIAVVNTVQIITFQSMIKLMLPPNVAMFQNTLVRLINVDLLDPEWTTAYVFDFDKDIELVETMQDQNTQSILGNQIINMGFETFNPILNLGGLFIILNYSLVIACASMVIISISYTYNTVDRLASEDLEGGKKELRRSKRLKKKIKAFAQSFLFNQPLVIMNESIVQLTVSGLLFLNMPQQFSSISQSENQTTYSFSKIFGIGCLVLSLGVLPLISVLILVLPPSMLEKPSIQDRIGDLYEDLHLNNRMSQLNNLFFLTRRLVICYIALFMQDSLGIQILVLLYMNLGAVIYIGNCRPYAKHSMNMQELFNEGIVYSLTCAMTMFTDFCPEVVTRYIVGWFFIALVIIVIIKNLKQIIKQQLLQLSQAAAKLFAMVKKKLSPFIQFFKKQKVEREKREQAKLTQLKPEYKEAQEERDKLKSKAKILIDQYSRKMPETEDLNILIVEELDLPEIDQEQKLKPSAPPDQKDVFTFLEADYQAVCKEHFLTYRKFLMDQERFNILRAQGLKNIDFSLLCSQEKVKLFYEYNSTKNLVTLYNDYKKKSKPNGMSRRQHHLNFIEDFIEELMGETDNSSRSSTSSIGEEDFDWDYIRDTWLQQASPKLDIKADHFFSLEYAEELIQKHEQINVHITWKHIDQFTSTSVFELGEKKHERQLWNADEVYHLGTLSPDERQKQAIQACQRLQRNPTETSQSIQQLYSLLRKYKQHLTQQDLQSIHDLAKQQLRSPEQLTLNFVKEVISTKGCIYVSQL